MTRHRPDRSARKALLDVEHYDVHFDLTVPRVRTRTEIRFRCNQPGASTFADLEVASVERMELNGRPLSTDAWKDDRLELHELDEENVLIVDATCDFADDREGLCAFDDGGERFVYTKGRPVGGPRYHCCFMDGGTSTFDLHVDAPKGHTVVSHAAPVRDGDTWHFTSPLPMGGFAFAAGPWASTADGVFARPSAAATLERSPLGEILTDVLACHADTLGVPHPFDQRALVVLPGYGGQGSSWGGLWYVHEQTLHASVDDEWRAYALWVLAHEAAHAWFGSLVGERGPEDRAHSEGMATYLCHRAMETLAPELHPWARFHVLEIAEAHEADDTGDLAHPSLVYAKPAAIARHLESVVGTRAVVDGLGRFVRRHSHAEASVADLVRCWEEAAGADLGAWSSAWLRTPGVDVLELDGGDVVRTSAGADRVHPVVVRAYDELPSGLVARAPVTVRVLGARTPIAVDDAALVVLDTAYAKVRLDARSRATLVRHLGALEPDVRAVCWVAMAEMVRDGLVAHDELRTLVDRHASVERDVLVRDWLSKR